LKILTVLGARPQFIKAATISREFAKASIPEVIVHTGQHYDANMSQVFFDEMQIPIPDYHLEIHGLNHGAMTGRMMEKVEDVIIKEKPNAVLVYGDTNSTLAGALTASKLYIPVIHVEAGLRSFNMEMPEEINRILTDRISKLLFCPTATAVKNLEAEGFRHFDCEILQSGDVMYDAVLFYKEKAKAQSAILQNLQLKKNDFVLVTIHRAENTNDSVRLQAIANALNTIAEQTTIVLPLHPRTKAYLQSNGITIGAKIIDPIGYFDMLNLLSHCKLVMTDSGGLQKEAYFFNKYCITLRDQTEWVELVAEKMNSLAGADSKQIVKAYEENKNKKNELHSLLYGKGNAAALIVQKIQSSI
jgi:UDP-GlcNAc3NAcA epimerase